MFHKTILLVLLVILAYLPINAQDCTTLGQNPSSAFPVCGTNTFSQSIVPYCGGRKVPGPCSRDDVLDTNPFWYKFTCFTSGTLGFLITPNDLGDDYDWQLFDITGRVPDDIYTDASLFVACNWSGHTGLTGASSAGTSLENCAGNYPLFSSMPSLTAGHNYLLLISHFTRFTPSQNGYSLSFGGGTASITDTLLPDMAKIGSSCDATRVTVTLNKKMKCSSLSPDGSDFTISPALASVVSAVGINCNTGFDMDSLALILSAPLPPGNYTLTIKNGRDGNTLLDNCDRNIAAQNSLPLVIAPLAPTPMDSLTAVRCAPQSLQLVFNSPIRCSSVAADGSDFIITGPSRVSVQRAQGNCTNGVSNVINVTLSAPVVSRGDYRIRLVRGTDGNTIEDACGQETPAGSSLPFFAEDTVSAEFTYSISSGCNRDTISFFNTSIGIDQWLWKAGGQEFSSLRNPVAHFSTLGDKTIALSVSNRLCSDTVTKIIPAGTIITADFETNDILCPEDAAVFANRSAGTITSYYWDFGNGNTSLAETPPPLHYAILSAERTYPVRLIVANANSCADTALKHIRVLKSCYIAVPNAFTPNSDGLNDFLYPVNAYKADSMEFRVYNRAGQLVFHSNDWTKKWDGRIKGYPQDSGIYVWLLNYVDHDTGKKVSQKGSTVLIR